jgi:predicted RNA-binding Zn-ribbon protein involved in translation (DUF1610 family)
VNIKCWSCEQTITSEARSLNDGDCPLCGAEIDLLTLCEELTKQRDELLAALREIAEWTERYTAPDHPISTVARAAIAKVEG